ncbi:response regulator transcription factor [Micromonospora fluostatini]|uniref:Sensory transduction protein RegX3 n=2 Tax=Micromonospora TaxID=1873 RepID=A0A0N7IRM1_9ACTN|nr:response regulator transcription factor [Micromonospora rosaria]ALJ99879.1 FlsR3 [Micromonospora rosaria]KXK58927.1 XRE family transcriptional regulator [Micromonospora rosaria]TDB93059.1 response regulator transcription factor [Micromonospora fluostatini]
MTRVLIVEGEASNAEALAHLVRTEGFTPTVTTAGPQAIEEFERNGADIVLLELRLPGMSGTEVCRQLRYRSTVPVVMLSGRDTEIDRVVGFEVGADDYVTKPYSARELILRIRAILRRGGQVTIEREVQPTVLSGGPVRMDVVRHIVTVNGAEVHIPLKEFELLEYLLRNPGRVLRRSVLIDRIWGQDYFGDTKTLDVHVRRLRSKIEEDPSSPRYLVNVRGLGFKFNV